MNNYAIRSASTELIDQPGIPFSDWATCLAELNAINTYLGGHAITIEGVKKLAAGKKKRLKIAEIGCGGGDNLKAIYQWSRKSGLDFEYTGIDINKACTDYAAINCSEIPGIELISSDYRAIHFKDDPPDIIFSSLFCHHFSNEQLIEMLLWMKQNACAGFFINDLERHPIAYHSIKWLTRLLSKSYLVKNDAPISVMRGFRRSEWHQLLADAGIEHYTINWRWAFRFLITVRND